MPEVVDCCGGPRCRGAKRPIVGAFVGNALVIRLCADCLPLVPGAEVWTTKKGRKRG